MKKVDAIIIGGGIASWVLAFRLIKHKGMKRVRIIVSEHFHNSSINNQSWLQSGCLYNGENEQERLVAKLCIDHGKKLLNITNSEIEIKGGTGIMALPNETEALKKIRFLKDIGNINYPEFIIKPEEVSKLLGAFAYSKNFNDETRFIWTPDQPFPEGNLLRNCENAFDAVKGCKKVPGDASISPSLLTKNGYIVTANGVDYDTKYLFVLAGANTKNLLRPLGIDKYVDVTARRCILLKADIKVGLNVDIYMDKINNTNINVVRNRKGEKVYLLGDGLYSNVADIDNLDRNVTDDEIKRFIENYCDDNKYPQIKDALSGFIKDKSNFNVCYKVEDKSYLPWIYNMGELTGGTFKNLHVAGAGKATLAFYVAEMLILKSGIDPTKVSDQVNTMIKAVSNITHWSE